MGLNRVKYGTFHGSAFCVRYYVHCLMPAAEFLLVSRFLLFSLLCYLPYAQKNFG